MRPALAVLVLGTHLACTSQGVRDPFRVVSNGQLAPNIALAVDSSGHRHDWVTVDNTGHHLDVAYPPGQSWGLVQFWLGLDLPVERPHEDFSEFHTLQLLLDGTWLGEGATVRIGIQGENNILPGQLPLEPITVQLPPHNADEGQTYYQLDLSQFDRVSQPSPRADLTSPTGFYFSGTCGSAVQIYEISLFKASSTCCASICIKQK